MPDIPDGIASVVVRAVTVQEAFEAGRLYAYDPISADDAALFHDSFEGLCAVCGGKADYLNVRATGPADNKRCDLPIIVTVVNCDCGMYGIEPKAAP